MEGSADGSFVDRHLQMSLGFGDTWQPKGGRGEHLGGGVVLYREHISTDWDLLRAFSEEAATKERDTMYVPGKDPIGGEDGYINRNGYFFPTESIEVMPQHCAYVQADARPEIQAVLKKLEDAKDDCLWDYLHLFPIAGMSIWWKIKSHILVYPKGGYLGMHADTSTDYAYGSPTPTDQIATRTVVSTIAFFNDHVETEEELDGTNFTGGVVHFGYLDIQYKPSKGDLLIFPSNYMASHAVSLVSGGPRYSHVGWYCQGTPNPEVNEMAVDPSVDPDGAKISTNVFMESGYSLEHPPS